MKMVQIWHHLSFCTDALSNEAPNAFGGGASKTILAMANLMAFLY
jgi:hypothetical protein